MRSPSGTSRPTEAHVPSVEIRDLCKSFHSVTALDGVSLSIETGEFVSFLGPSGCGKTTLLRIIAGLETPTSGAVSILGKDVTSVPPYQRNIGLVFQNYALFPHKSVEGNINFGLRHRTALKSTERSKAIDRALALVRLREYRTRKPHQLSGGQQQRIALARAVATEPEVLLLDEPLSNLDAKLRDEMRVELKELHDKLGLTFVYVTHDRTEALSMSDRVVVLRDGRIEQIAPPKILFEQPTSVHVARFMGHENLLPATLRAYSNGRAQVKLEHGPVVEALAPENVIGANRVWLLVRNNGVVLRTVGERHKATLESISGRIRSVLYQGLHVEVHIEIAGQIRLRVELPAHESEHLRSDMDVSIDILGAGTWVLNEE